MDTFLNILPTLCIFIALGLLIWRNRSITEDLQHLEYRLSVSINHLEELHDKRINALQLSLKRINRDAEIMRRKASVQNVAKALVELSGEIEAHREAKKGDTK